MMCIACEQDALWYAYLQRRGLITPEGYLVEQPPFLADPIESEPAQAEAQAQDEKKPDGATIPAEKSEFSCDDPKVG
jgi:hypothetical protein